MKILLLLPLAVELFWPMCGYMSQWSVQSLDTLVEQARYIFFIITLVRFPSMQRHMTMVSANEEVITHSNDAIMGAVASQITSLTLVFSTFYSDADQRKHQSSASVAFVREIHRGPVNSPHKWPVTRKMFPLDDVIITCNVFSPWISKWLKSKTNIWRISLLGRKAILKNTQLSANR